MLLSGLKCQAEQYACRGACVRIALKVSTNRHASWRNTEMLLFFIATSDWSVLRKVTLSEILPIRLMHSIQWRKYCWRKR